MRSILWKEYKKQFFPATFEWLLNYPVPPELQVCFKRHGKTRYVHDVFQYAVYDGGEHGTPSSYAIFTKGSV